QSHAGTTLTNFWITVAAGLMGAVKIPVRLGPPCRFAAAPETAPRGPVRAVPGASAPVSLAVPPAAAPPAPPPSPPVRPPPAADSNSSPDGETPAGRVLAVPEPGRPVPEPVRRCARRSPLELGAVAGDVAAGAGAEVTGTLGATTETGAVLTPRPA